MKEPLASLLRSSVFLCGALPAALIDIKRLRIPRAVPLAVIPCLLAIDLLSAPLETATDAIAAALAFSSLFAIRRTVGGIGAGDLNFAAMAACFAGFPYCVFAMSAAAIAALLCFGIRAAFSGIERGLKIPFAPFLAGGALLGGALRLLSAG